MKYLGTLVSAFLAGVVFSFSGAVQLQSSDSSFAVAALSTVGLFLVLMFNLSLFTSKLGYAFADSGIIDKRVEELPIVLIGNLAGAILTGFALHPVYTEQFNVAALAFLHTSPVKIFVSAIFCGALIFFAVHGFYRMNGSPLGCLVAFLAAATICFCKFNYFITDIFFVAGALMFEANNIFVLIFSIVGNMIGVVAFAMLYDLKKQKGSRRQHRKHSSLSDKEKAQKAAEEENEEKTTEEEN